MKNPEQLLALADELVAANTQFTSRLHLESPLPRAAALLRHEAQRAAALLRHEAHLALDRQAAVDAGWWVQLVSEDEEAWLDPDGVIRVLGGRWMQPDGTWSHGSGWALGQALGRPSEGR